MKPASNPERFSVSRVGGEIPTALLRRGADADLAEAEAAIERISVEPIAGDAAVRDVWLLRLWALLAQAHGDDAAYAQFRDRYRDKADSLGFEGHIDWAEAMQRQAVVQRSPLSLRTNELRRTILARSDGLISLRILEPPRTRKVTVVGEAAG